MADPLLQRFGFQPAEAAQEAPQAAPAPQGAAPAAAPPAAPAAPAEPAYDGSNAPPVDVSATQPVPGNTFGKVVKDLAVGATELPGAIAHGAVAAVNEMSNTAFEVAQWADRYVPLGQIEITRKGFEWKSGQPEQNNLQSPNPFPQPTTVTGGMGEGVSQFITAYALGGKLLKMTRGFGASFTAGRAVPGVTAATTKGKLVEAAINTTFAGAAGFDPSEARLSNLIQESPTFANPINEFLASSPDDSRAAGRFKNALEQLAVNMPLEGLFYAVRGLKAKRAGEFDKAEADAAKAERAILKWQEAGNDNAPVAPKFADESPVAVGQADTMSPWQSEGTVSANDNAGQRTITPHEFGEDDAINGLKDRLEGGEMPQIYRDSDVVDEFATGQANENVSGRSPQASSLPGETPPPAEPPYTPPKFDQQNLLDTFALASGNGSNVDTFAGSIVGKNMARVNNENDAKTFFNVLGTLEAERFAKAKGRPRTLEEMQKAAEDSFQKLADYTGTDVGQLRVRMAADVKNLDELADRVAGYRMGVEVYSKRASELARAILKGDASEFGGQLPELQAEFLKTAQTLLSIAPLSEGVKSGLGRNLSMLRSKVGPGERPVGPLAAEGEASGAGAAMQADLGRAMQGNDAFVQSLAKKLALADNPKIAKRVVDDAFGPGVFDAVNEYWINALLSGTKTHVVNMLTSTLKSALVMPSEQLLAGLTQGDTASMRMAADQYVGMFMSMKDALKLSARAMKEGDAVLDPTSQGMGEMRHAIKADTFGLDTSTPLGMLVEGLGTIARLPGRLLTTEDELLKQLSYRGRLYSMGMRELREMKRQHSISDKDAGEFMAEFMERGFDPNGRAINEDALAYARDATFTNDLDVPVSIGTKSLGEIVNQAANSHPGLKMILPFTRVPTNIMRDAWDHTPGLNMLRKAYREELFAGGERGAIAKAKMAAGGAMWSAALMMAANGDITGNLSSDPTTRNLEQDAGKQANSIRFHDENGKPYYVDYSRLDPYATFFSVAATVAEASGHMSDWEMEDIAGSVVVGLAKNLESKTYLQGLMQWMGAMADPDNRGKKMLERHMASFIPSVTNSFKGADYLTDAHGIAQAMLARTPGHPGVDKRYNVLGEPVKTPDAFGPTWLSPFAMSSGDRVDPTLGEIARLSQVHKGGIGYPPTSREFGGDLRDIHIGNKTAYARFQELVGEGVKGQPTLRERMTELFNSRQYKEELHDGDAADNGSRLWAVNYLLGAHRRQAEGLLMQENPEFAAKYEAEKAKKYETYRSGKQQP